MSIRRLIVIVALLLIGGLAIYGVMLQRDKANLSAENVPAENVPSADGIDAKLAELRLASKARQAEDITIVRATLRGHTDTVLGMSFSPDGNLLASCSADKTVRLWDTNTRKLVHTLEAHEGLVRDVAFSPDGKWLVSGGEDRQVILWNAATGDVQNVWQTQMPATHVAFLPDGKHVAALVQEVVSVWELDSDAAEKTYPLGESGSAMAILPDGRMVTGNWEGEVTLWELPAGEKKRIRTRAKTRHAEDNDGKNVIQQLVALDASRVLIVDVDAVWLWDLGKDTILGMPWGGMGAVAAYDGGRMIMGGRDQGTCFWQMEGNYVGDALLRKRQAAVAMSPDGRFAACATAGGYHAPDYKWIHGGESDISIFNLAGGLKTADRINSERLAKGYKLESRLDTDYVKGLGKEWQ